MSAAPGAAAAARIPVNRAAITLCVMLATIMQALDTTIANVALPHMQGTLSASQDQINWVLTSYIVAAAIMTPPTGWLAGRFGRKPLFVITVCGFTLASALCGAAQSLEEIVLFRLLQGVFGAPLVPLSQAVLLDIYPRERQGWAMAIWGMGIMIGPILGPALGAWLTENHSWRWVFYINLPVGAAALAGILVFLPDTPRERESALDWFGFATLGLAIGALQLLLDRGEQLDWFGSAEIVIEAGICVLCFYLFVAHMLTAEKPFISPALFMDRNFTPSLVVAFIHGMVLFATLSLLTPFVQGLMGYPVITTGLIMGPRGIGTMAAILVVGRLVGRVDGRALMALGLSLTAATLWEMTGFTADVSQWTLIRTGIMQGFGLGCIFVPLSTIAFATMPPRMRTEGTSVFTVMRNLGGSVGISMTSSLLIRNMQASHAEIAEQVTPFNRMFEAPAIGKWWSPLTTAGQSALNDEITRQATTIAFVNDFKLMMIFTLIAIPLVLLLRNPPRPRPEA